MTDRDKIVEGLSICIENIDRSCPLGCPYYDKCTNYEGRFVFQPLLRDTLKLMKEQEPVEPRIQTSGSGVTWWNVCGNCQTAINPNDKFCHECGRPLKWQ